MACPCFFLLLPTESRIGLCDPAPAQFAFKCLILGNGYKFFPLPRPFDVGIDLVGITMPGDAPGPRLADHDVAIPVTTARLRAEKNWL